MPRSIMGSQKWGHKTALNRTLGTTSKERGLDPFLMGFWRNTLFLELNETLLVGDPKPRFPDGP